MTFRKVAFLAIVAMLGIVTPVLAASDFAGMGQSASHFVAGYGFARFGDAALLIMGIAGLLIGRRSSKTGRKQTDQADA